MNDFLSGHRFTLWCHMPAKIGALLILLITYLLTLWLKKSEHSCLPVIASNICHYPSRLPNDTSQISFVLSLKQSYSLNLQPIKAGWQVFFIFFQKSLCILQLTHIQTLKANAPFKWQNCSLHCYTYSFLYWHHDYGRPDVEHEQNGSNEEGTAETLLNWKCAVIFFFVGVMPVERKGSRES